SSRLRVSELLVEATAQVGGPVGKSGLTENSTTTRRKPEAGTTKSAPVFTSLAARKGGGPGSLAISHWAVPFSVTTITARLSAGAPAASARSKVIRVPLPSTTVLLTVAPGPVTSTAPPAKFEPVTVIAVVAPGTTR